MSAKLIVHKFENGRNKSLLITIAERDNHLSETEFGEWLEGRTFQTKKENQKSSRLVVKIVAGNEFSNFNLDTCAKLVENSSFSNDGVTVTGNPSISATYATGYNKDSNTIQHCDYGQVLTEPTGTNTNIRINFYDEKVTLNSLSPLEYSLEKVKENNARIMENIHMLNRTLNYTKKKEILDIVCPKSMRSYPCKTCGKCFVYETGLKRHHTMRHAILESQPRWQVVWTCIECFQVWPQQDLALNHSKQCSKIDSPDCVREIRTSSLLQCEFCEKVFTSIPRLLRHAKMHSTHNNYECNTCEIPFTSFRDAEEHWLLCPWLKAYYSFSLPKLLLCNACDRKFRNYDQLYNHRYKIGHFMAKNNSASLGTLTYQCEMCAQCFLSVSPLQVHKRQCHPFNDMVSNYNDFQNTYYSTNNKHDTTGEMVN